MEILLLAIGSRRAGSPNDGVKRLLELIGRSPDWRELSALANRHRVMPLLYLGLQQISWSNVPDKVRQGLRLAYAANLKRNFRLASHATELLHAFSGCGVRVIPFKGVFLAQSAYGQLSSRQVNDIDLLIDENDCMVAGMILESLGYASVERLDQQEVFRNLVTQTEIDLHWHIAPDFFPVSFDFDTSFGRTRSRELAGTSFNDLGLRDLLLLLSVQLAKDCWERQQKLIHLQKICDMARVIELMDEGELISTVKEAKNDDLSRVLNFGLILVSELQGTQLPVDLEDGLNRDIQARKLARQSVTMPELALTELPPERNSLLDLGLRLRQLRFYMGLRESWKNRVSHLQRILRTISAGDAGAGQGSLSETELDRVRSGQLLSVVAFGATETAVETWEIWLSAFDLDSVDFSVYWMLPALYKGLSTQGYEGPENGRLAGIYKQMRLSNAKVESGLSELLESLLEQGCQVLIGPHASLVLEEIVSLIWLKPLQIIARPEDLELVDELLRRGGWKPDHTLPPRHLRPFIPCVKYQHSTQGTADLIWRPMGVDIPVGRESLIWESCVTGSRAIAAASTPSREDQALMVALRGTRIQKTMLYRWLNVDWRKVESRARALGLQPEIIRSELYRAKDERASYNTVMRRHWRRYRACPAHLKPATFPGYLLRYYSWSWQSGGLVSGLKAAIGRRR